MKVKVFYQAAFSDLAGREEETIQAERLTLEELLDMLVVKYGDQFKELLFHQNSKSISTGVVVFVNSVFTPPHTQLRDGDEVAFLMPLAGG